MQTSQRQNERVVGGRSRNGRGTWRVAPKVATVKRTVARAKGQPAASFRQPRQLSMPSASIVPGVICKDCWRA
eukprot:scaffold34641_cov140-Isochrysis_galbana.AAC.2